MAGLLDYYWPVRVEFRRTPSAFGAQGTGTRKPKGLRRFYESGSVAGMQPQHARRLRMQLVALDSAQVIEDMDIHNPAHPGEFITAVFLEPNGLSGREVAAKLGVAPSTRRRAGLPCSTAMISGAQSSRWT